MDIDYNPVKTYTNTITQSVGPTTSSTSRSLVDTDTAHYIYLDATNGNDANPGYPNPSDAKATFNAAFSALTGVRQVIHILDSSTYTKSGATAFTAAASSGVQAALGQAPVIFNSDDNALILSDSSGGGKFLSGIILYTDATVRARSLVGLASAGDYTIKDCYIINLWGDTTNSKRDNMAIKQAEVAFTGTINISNNICATASGASVIQVNPSTNSSGVTILGNILYLQTEPSSVDNETDFRISFTTVNVNFDAQTEIATLTAGSLTPGQWAGYTLSMVGAGGLYYITANSATQFYLEDKFNTNSGNLTGVNATTYGFGDEQGILISGSPSGSVYATVKKNIIVANNNLSGISSYADTGYTVNQVTVEGNVFS